jgi:8-oxo-dGTP pyrophosphatase MutT (NUDIX family)
LARPTLQQALGDDPLAEVERRLAGLRPRRSRLPLKRAAVLVPLYRDGSALRCILTRRSEGVRQPGQVSFPGGRIDPGEDPQDAAIREAHEELDIPPAVVEPLGVLHDVIVGVTGYVFTPYVAQVPADLQLRPNPAEVARAFAPDLLRLADPSVTPFTFKPKRFGGRTFQVPYFEWEDEVIWGATGRVLVDLLQLLGLMEP